MNRTSSRFIVGATVIVAMTAAACQGTAGRLASRTPLNVLVYRVGYPLIADHLRRALSHAMPGMDVVVRPSEGSALRDVEQVQSGEADVAFPLADTAYLASVGQLEGQSRRYDQIRGIAVLQLNPVLLLVRGDSDIHDIESLRRHRVGIGGVGSSTSQTARIVIRALGLDVTEVHIDGLDPSIASLAAGQVDAIFAVASYSRSIPAAVRAGARILSLSGPTIAVGLIRTRNVASLSRIERLSHSFCSLPQSVFCGPSGASLGLRKSRPSVSQIWSPLPHRTVRKNLSPIGHCSRNTRTPCS